MCVCVCVCQCVCVCAYACASHSQVSSFSHSPTFTPWHSRVLHQALSLPFCFAARRLLRKKGGGPFVFFLIPVALPSPPSGSLPRILLCSKKTSKGKGRWPGFCFYFFIPVALPGRGLGSKPTSRLLVSHMIKFRNSSWVPNRIRIMIAEILKSLRTSEGPREFKWKET